MRTRDRRQAGFRPRGRRAHGETLRASVPHHRDQAGSGSSLRPASREGLWRKLRRARIPGSLLAPQTRTGPLRGAPEHSWLRTHNGVTTWPYWRPSHGGSRQPGAATPRVWWGRVVVRVPPAQDCHRVRVRPRRWAGRFGKSGSRSSQPRGRAGTSRRPSRTPRWGRGGGTSSPLHLGAVGARCRPGGRGRATSTGRRLPGPRRPLRCPATSAEAARSHQALVTPGSGGAAGRGPAGEGGGTPP